MITTDTYNKAACSLSELKESEQKFLDWLESVGYTSYDPYDIWGTKFGLWSRKIYYGKGILGLPFIAPFILIDFFCPSARKLFVKKERFATADGQLLLAFLNMYRVSSDAKYLDKAIALSQDLLDYSISGYRGYCWGYPFDWQNSKDTMWSKNTPYITCTPYCFEAFIELYDETKDERFYDIAESISKFVYEDLNDTSTSENSAAGSYSPIDNSKVINASAYRAWLLIEASKRFNKPEYKERGLKNLNFILENQQPDGSWLYAVVDEGKSFIDHFHTCFVLKNLYKLNEVLQDENVTRSIIRGFEYHKTHLFHEDGNPKSFSQEPRFQVTQIEMYNFAESITLGALLKPLIPEAYGIGHTLAKRLVTQHQLPRGYFKTRIFKGGINHTFPFLRWPQAQLYYAITNLFHAAVKEQDYQAH